MDKYVSDMRFLFVFVLQSSMTCCAFAFAKSSGPNLILLDGFDMIHYCISIILAFVSSIAHLKEGPSDLRPFGSIKRIHVSSIANSVLLLYQGLKILFRSHEYFENKFDESIHDNTIILYCVIKYILMVFPKMICFKHSEFENSDVCLQRPWGSCYYVIYRCWDKATSFMRFNSKCFIESQETDHDPEDRMYMYLARRNNCATRLYHSPATVKSKQPAKVEAKNIRESHDSDDTMKHRQIDGKISGQNESHLFSNKFSYENEHIFPLTSWASGHLIWVYGYLIIHISLKWIKIPEARWVLLKGFGLMIQWCMGIYMIYWGLKFQLMAFGSTHYETPNHIDYPNTLMSITKEFPVVVGAIEYTVLSIEVDYYILLTRLQVESLEEYSKAYKEIIHYLRGRGLREIYIEPQPKHLAGLE